MEDFSTESFSMKVNNKDLKDKDENMMAPTAAIPLKPTGSSIRSFDTMALGNQFFLLFYAREKGALGIWDKRVGSGYIKRRIETEGTKRYHTLEIINNNPRSNSTFIMAPKQDWKSLHLPHPHLFLVMKNFRGYFSFEVQVLDSRGQMRRFRFANWFSTAGGGRRMHYLCHVPLRLEMGWNEIHVDFNELLDKVYRTKFVEVVRVVLNANCRLRQVFSCTDPLAYGLTLIPGMKLFSNLKLLNPTFGPLSHPNHAETGPFRHKNNPYIQFPSLIEQVTRVEQDLGLLQLTKACGISPTELMGEGPIATQFRKELRKLKESNLKLSEVVEVQTNNYNKNSELMIKNKKKKAEEVEERVVNFSLPEEIEEEIDPEAAIMPESITTEEDNNPPPITSTSIIHNDLIHT